MKNLKVLALILLPSLFAAAADSQNTSPQQSPAAPAAGSKTVKLCDDKTTVAFSVRDGRGALVRALAVFDEEGINLSRIESRPSREKSWDYVFLADLVGHREDANVARSMTRLRETCPMVKHLGSYPRAKHGVSES